MEKRNYIVKDENGKPIKTFFCKNADSVGTWTRDEYFRKGLGKKVYIYDTNGTLHITAEILKKKDGTIGQRWSRAAGNTSGGAMNENNAEETVSKKENWLNNHRNGKGEEDFVLCDAKVTDPERVVGILEKIFPVDISEILKERYRKMRDNYLKKWTPDDGIWKQNGYDIVEGLPDALLSVKTDERWGELHKLSNLGHDLPIWMYYKKPRHKTGEERPRVMIVSQDPLRDGHTDGKLLLSSPWALHSRNYLKDGATLPQHIIHELLDYGAIVYVTDFLKLYANHSSGKKYNVLGKNKDFKEKCGICLQEEIKLFQPNLIITFGRPVIEEIGAIFELCSDDNSSVTPANAWGMAKIIDAKPLSLSLQEDKSQSMQRTEFKLVPLLHPSGNNRGAIKNVIMGDGNLNQKWMTYVGKKLNFAFPEFKIS